MSDGQAPVNSSESSSESTVQPSSALPHAAEGNAPLRPLTEQQTVISDRPPMSADQLSKIGNPMEAGKSLLGQKLGHFQLEEFIGGGGMGAVFRATDTELGRSVAVKVLAQDMADGDGKRRFRNEAQSAARLDHRNIARVHHIGAEGSWNYIVFEYIQGVNIRDLVDLKGPLPLSEAVAYAMQIAEALDHASEREVVHRDIKPSNIIITPQGRAKLVDLGLARIRDPQQQERGPELTVSGVTLGTFDYISPEQARDPRSTDVRSDIYSLGCTLYYMLIGNPPFPDSTGIQKLIDHNTETPVDPIAARPELPDDVGHIVRKMMEKDPEDRYQTARELLGELLLLADRLQLPCASDENLVLAPVQVKRSIWEMVLPVLIPSVLLVVAIALLDVIIPSASLRLPKPMLPNEADIGAKQVAAKSSKSSTKQPATKDGKKKSDGVATSAKQKQPAGAGNTTNKQGSGASKSGTNGKGGSPRNLVVTKESGNVMPPSLGQGGLAAAPSIEGNLGSPEVDGQLAGGSSTAKDVRTIVVGGSGDLPATYERVGTLLAALQKAKSSAAITAIELQTNEILELPSFELALKQKNFTVRAGIGFQPTLMFRPRNDKSFRRSSMISIRQVRVHWQGIRFHLNFAPNAWRDNWSLFEIGQLERISFDRCVLTIRNLGKDGKPLHAQVAFFSMLARRTMGKMGNMNDSPPIPVPEVRFTRCIVRGQATMFRADVVTPFQLNWEQGLFVSTERLLEAGGSHDKPRFEDGRAVDIRLQNVTVIADKGLCLLSMEQDSPYQLDLFTNCTKCIFSIGKDAALFEYSGRESSDMLRKPASISGNFNFYQAKTVLRLRPDESDDSITEFMLDENRERWISQEKWYNEKSARAMVANQWQTARPTNRSVDQQRPQDYLIVTNGMPARTGDSNNEMAGFDAKALPVIKITPPSS